MEEPGEMVTRFPVLTPQECQQVREDIYSMKALWKKRSANIPVPFYTLGAASYRDAENWAVFAKLVQEVNPFLKMRFGWLYDRVAKVLTEGLGVEAVYHEALSLPGFHIFQYHRLFEYEVASRHCDLQFLRIPWGKLGIKAVEPWSFTLSIRLPKTGGGLYVWPIHHNDVKGMPPSEWETVLKKTPYEFHEYHEGEMVMHKGLLFHQIAPVKNGQEGDERITLQAHGIQDHEKLYVYW